MQLAKVAPRLDVHEPSVWDHRAMKIAVAAALLALLLAFAAHAGPLYAPVSHGNALCPSQPTHGPVRIAWRPDPLCCAGSPTRQCATPLAIGRILPRPASSGLHS